MTFSKNAIANKKSSIVQVDGVTIDLNFESPFSGFTSFQDNAFTIGKDVFELGPDELGKTVLHELYRLSKSLLAGGAKVDRDAILNAGFKEMQDVIDKETAAAAKFAADNIDKL